MKFYQKLVTKIVGFGTGFEMLKKTNPTKNNQKKSVLLWQGIAAMGSMSAGGLFLLFSIKRIPEEIHKSFAFI